MDDTLIVPRNQALELIVEIEGKFEHEEIQCYISNMNNRYAQYYNVDKKQVIGKHITDIRDVFASVYLKIISWFFDNEMEDSVTIYVNQKNDSIEIIPLGEVKDEKSQLWEMIGYVQDRENNKIKVLMILKDIHKELNYIKDKITVRDIKSYNDIILNLSDIISNLSHAWRQPLNSLNFSIINFMDEIEETYDHSVKEEFYKEIWQIIKSLSREIEKFKAFFEMDYKKSYFDISKYLDLVFEILDEKIKQEHVDIQVHIKEEVNKYGSPKEFLQIMYCILFDLIEHCKNEFDTPNRNINIQITKNKNHVLLEMNLLYDKEQYPDHILQLNHLSMFQNIIHRKMQGTIDLINDGAEQRLMINFPLEV